MKIAEGALLALYLAYSALWIYVWIVRFSVIQFYQVFSWTAAYYILISLITGLGAFPLYKIAEEELGSLAAFMISTAYLFYFPLAGANWSGADTAFPVLIFLAYHLQRGKKERISAALYALSAILGPVESLLSFSLMAYNAFKLKKKIYYTPLLISLVSILAYAFYKRFPAVSLSSGFISAGLFGILIVLLPLLFADVLSYWSLALIPLIFLSLFSEGYQYPGLVVSGAVTPFVPFIFLGVVKGASYMGRIDKKKLKVFSILLLINAFSFAAVYQPFSPLNQYSTIDYGLATILSSYNQARELYGNITGMLKLLPPGSKVLVQGSAMPPGKVTLYSINQVGVNQAFSFKYVLVGPNSSYFGPMSSVAERLYDSNYGILAEAAGMVLLEKNYSGPLVYYRPTSLTWQADKLIPLGDTVYQNGYLKIYNMKGMQAWYIPYNFIPPGNYTLVIYVKQSSPSPSNMMSIAIFSDNLTHLLGFTYIKSNAVNTSWTEVSYNFSIPSIYENVEIFAFVNSWYGSLLISNVSVIQRSQV